MPCLCLPLPQVWRTDAAWFLSFVLATGLPAAVTSATALFGCMGGKCNVSPQCQGTRCCPQDGFARAILPFGCSVLELLRRPLSQEAGLKTKPNNYEKEIYLLSSLISSNSASVMLVCVTTFRISEELYVWSGFMLESLRLCVQVRSSSAMYSCCRPCASSRSCRL